jgi:hypothetical protein
MVGRSLVLVCVAQLLAAGGGQAVAFDGVSPDPGSGAAVRSGLPPLARVDSRLAIYGDQLARWRELGERTASPALAVRRPAGWSECSAAVEHLARSYGRLKEEIVSRNEPATDIVPWQAFSDDVAFLEGGCGQLFQQVSALTGGGEPQGVAPVQPEAARQKAPLGEQEQLEKWNRAVGLFDSGKYDEALGEFAGLLDTPQAAAAREKIREAQTLVATQLRRQAATILARKTDDPAQKKKLLEESWALLNKIISRYPEAAIIDKVKQNQAQIENQLDQLDPALLQRLKGGPAS